jgi:hypothetical protein
MRNFKKVHKMIYPEIFEQFDVFFIFMIAVTCDVSIRVVFDSAWDTTISVPYARAFSLKNRSIFYLKIRGKDMVKNTWSETGIGTRIGT